MYELRKPETKEDRKKYHDIRRVVLFEERGRFNVYDESHPDEHKKGNHPFLLAHNGRPVATVRQDHFKKDGVIVRLLAMFAEERGKGHGMELLGLVEDYARKNGRNKLVVNAAPEALGFYRKAGFVEEIWDAEELKQFITEDCIQMTKLI